MLSFEEFKYIYCTLAHKEALCFARQLGTDFATALKWVQRITKDK